jgi:hypothetical protein
LTTAPIRDSITTDRLTPGYTLHIDFTASSFAHARLVATDLAEGLSRLRADIDMCSAQISAPTTPHQLHPVFCGLRVPHGERRADEPGHGGRHSSGRHNSPGPQARPPADLLSGRSDSKCPSDQTTTPAIPDHDGFSLGGRNRRQNPNGYFYDREDP